MLVDLLELLLIVDFITQTPLHNILANIFDTVHEQAFKFVLLGNFIYFFGFFFTQLSLFLFYLGTQIPDGVGVVSLHDLNIFPDLLLDLILLKFGFEEDFEELAKFDVFSHYVPVAAHGASGNRPPN